MKTPENSAEGPDPCNPKAAGKEYIQMECTCDYLCS